MTEHRPAPGLIPIQIQHPVDAYPLPRRALRDASRISKALGNSPTAKSRSRRAPAEESGHADIRDLVAPHTPAQVLET